MNSNSVKKNINSDSFVKNPDMQFNKYHKRWKTFPIAQKVAVILFWAMSPVLFFYLPYNIILELAIRENPAALFFGIFDRFTYLSNWFNVFVLLLFALNPYHSWFRGNRLLLASASFMIFTFVGYNTVLYEGYGFQLEEIRENIDPGTNRFMDVNAFIQNVYTHVINPLAAIFFFFFVCWKGNYQITTSYWKQTILTVIFPTIYLLYVISVPFTNWQTNDRFEFVVINPTQEQIDSGAVEPYSVYGAPTNTNGNPVAWAYCLGFYTGFWLWTVGLHWLMILIYKKTGKRDLIINVSKKRK